MKVPEKQNSQRGNKGSQHIPKHVTRGGTISASTHATKKAPPSNWDNSKYTQALVRMGSERMHAPTVTQARPRYSHICMYCWHLQPDTSLLHPPHCTTERRRQTGNKQAASSRLQTYWRSFVIFIQIYNVASAHQRHIHSYFCGE